MRLLLDTNIVIPLVNRGSGDLPQRLRDALNEHDCYVSAVSLWEMTIKIRISKLHLECQPDALPTLVQDLGLRRLDISFAHAVADVIPEPATRDPFDRLLLAQCAVEGMRLVTVDRALAAHPFAWR